MAKIARYHERNADWNFLKSRENINNNQMEAITFDHGIQFILTEFENVTIATQIFFSALLSRRTYLGTIG